MTEVKFMRGNEINRVKRPAYSICYLDVENSPLACGVFGSRNNCEDLKFSF